MKTKFDPLVPLALKKTQQWFGSIIERPIDTNSRMLTLSPKGKPMTEEARIYIAPSPTLEPHQRIELYNQQYWWRLLTALHESFPLLTRLFGYFNFNQEIAVPYLVKYPPNDWSLNNLGSRLPNWVRESYHSEDRKLVLDAAELDQAFNASFVEKQLPSIDSSTLPTPGDLSSLLNKKLFLQPHIHLFRFDYDLFTFRSTFIKEDGDYWLDHDFPKLIKDKTYFFALYRIANQDISWKEISQGEFFLLGQFQKGVSIEKACQSLEKASEDICREAADHLQHWIQEWVLRRWLSLSKS